MTRVLDLHRRKELWCVSARGLQPMCMGGGFLKPAGSLSRELRPAWSMPDDVSQRGDEGVQMRQHLFVWRSFKV